MKKINQTAWVVLTAAVAIAGLLVLGMNADFLIASDDLAGQAIIRGKAPLAGNQQCDRECPAWCKANKDATFCGIGPCAQYWYCSSAKVTAQKASPETQGMFR